MSTKQASFEPYGDATFCDDIRHEVGGQVNLIGVYRSDIVVPELPFVMPKFGISVTVVMPPLGKVDHHIELDVFMPGDTDKASINVANDIAADQLPPTRGDRESDIPPHMKMVQQFVVSPLELSQAGFIKVRVRINDLHIKAGVIRVSTPTLASSAPENQLKIQHSERRKRA